MANSGSPSLFPPHLHTIFVDTSIDTHLAMAVPLHYTVREVKEQIMAEHARCFQDIGEISIRAIKVRRRGFFYNLVDSMCVWNAFYGFKGSWSVSIDAVPMHPLKKTVVATSEVTHAHSEHQIYEGVVTYSCEPEKNSSFDGHENLNPIIVGREHVCGPNMLIDQEKNGVRKNGVETSDAVPVTYNGERSKTFQQDKLLESLSQNHPKKDKTDKKFEDKVHEEHLQSPIESGLSRTENIDEHLEDSRGVNNVKLPTSLEALTGELALKNVPQGKGSMTSQQDRLLGSQPQNYLEEKKGKKVEDKLHEAHLESQIKSGLNGSENIDEYLEDGRRDKNENLPTLVRLTSELLLKNTKPLQNSPGKKYKKRKRKNCKPHKKAPLAMPFNILVPQSSLATVNPPSLGKDADSSSFFEKCPNKSNNNLTLLPNGDGGMRIASEAASSFEVINLKEKDGHFIKEPIADQILRFNSDNQREKHLYLDQATGSDVRFKEPEEAKISPRAPYELPTLFCCSTDKLTNQSSKGLEPNAANHQQNGELDTASCSTVLNPTKSNAEPVIEKADFLTFGESFLYEKHTTNSDFDSISGEMHHSLDKEAGAAVNLKGGNEQRPLTQVYSEVQHILPHSRKKLKVESSGVCVATKVNVDQEHFKPVSALASLKRDYNDESNAAKCIKLADSKANGGYCENASIKICSSPSKIQVSHLNSSKSLIDPLHISSEASISLAKQLPKIKITSQPDSVVFATPCHSWKISKDKLAEVGYPETDVSLSKSNREVIGSSNQKIEHLSVDAEATVSDDDFSRLTKISKVSPLDLSSLEPQDICDLSNTKIIIEDAAAPILSHEDSKCDRKNSKKNALKPQASSKTSKFVELRRHGNAGINFSDYFVRKERKHASAIFAVKPPTDSVQSDSHKFHRVKDPTHENDNRHCDVVDLAKKYVVKKPKQSNMQNSLERVESISFLNKDLESAPMKCFNSSLNSSTVGNAVGLNNFGVSTSKDTANQAVSSDSTEDIPDHLRRFRVVRKIPIRRHSKQVLHEHDERVCRPEMLINHEKVGAGKNEGKTPDLEASEGMPAVCSNGERYKTSQKDKLLESQPQDHSEKEKKDKIVENKLHEPHIEIHIECEMSRSEPVEDSKGDKNENLSTSLGLTSMMLSLGNAILPKNSSERKHLKRKSKKPKYKLTLVPQSSHATLDPHSFGKEADVSSVLEKRPTEPNSHLPLSSDSRDTRMASDATTSFEGISMKKKGGHLMEEPIADHTILLVNSGDQREIHINLGQETSGEVGQSSKGLESKEIKNTSAVHAVNFSTDSIQMKSFNSKALDTTAVEDSKAGHADKQNPLKRIESNSSLHKDHEFAYLFYSPRRNSVVGINNVGVSPSEGITIQAASSDSTEDIPDHLRRFRVVRKVPIRRFK